MRYISPKKQQIQIYITLPREKKQHDVNVFFGFGDISCRRYYYVDISTDSIDILLQFVNDVLAVQSI
jgi:hypothetical protein